MAPPRSDELPERMELAMERKAPLPLKIAPPREVEAFPDRVESEMERVPEFSIVPLKLVLAPEIVIPEKDKLAPEDMLKT